MVGERGVNNAACHKGSDSDNTAVARREFVGAAPNLTEQHIVVELSKFRCEIAELVAAGSLARINFGGR